MTLGHYTIVASNPTPSSLINRCLALAESDQHDYSELNTESFRQALKELRQQDEEYYTFQVKPRLRALKPKLPNLSDIEKHTKPHKITQSRLTPLEEGKENAPRQGKTDLFIRWCSNGLRCLTMIQGAPMRPLVLKSSTMTPER
jgi:hypothetical protein